MSKELKLPYSSTKRKSKVLGPSTSRLASRIFSTVPLPLCNVFLTILDIYGDGPHPKTPILTEHFEKEGRVEISAALKIVKDATRIFQREPNVLILRSPITIVGDTHGQFFDLLSILKIGGSPVRNQYLFLGDYVDRGSFSTEVVLTLFSIKINYPDSFWLLRGNHESRHMTAALTFKHECEVKYNLEFYDICMKAFDALPLSAVIDSDYICMHGGISPNIKTIDDIRRLHRFREPPYDGAMCDILWADPFPDYEEYTGDELYKYNDMRACSYYYSLHAVSEFLSKNELRCVIRAHEYQTTGSKIYKTLDTKANLITLFTIFSCPNYMDIFQNKGALIRFEDNKFNIKHFSAAEHPYWFPGLVDAFSFTMPFVFENVTKILVSILKSCTEGGDISESSEAREDILAIRESIRCFARFANFYTIVRYSMQRKCSLGIYAHPVADEDSRLDIGVRMEPPSQGFFKHIIVGRVWHYLKNMLPQLRNLDVEDSEEPISSRKH